jgi:hypothetical protein
MYTMFNNNVLIIVEINEPNKAPDLRYITIGCSDINETDGAFEASAIAAFKEGKSYPTGTTFVSKGVMKFNSVQQYIMFVQNQLADYLDTLK